MIMNLSAAPYRAGLFPPALLSTQQCEVFPQSKLSHFPQPWILIAGSASCSSQELSHLHIHCRPALEASLPHLLSPPTTLRAP